jgi:hypothetical protein
MRRASPQEKDWIAPIRVGATLLLRVTSESPAGCLVDRRLEVLAREARLTRPIPKSVSPSTEG